MKPTPHRKCQHCRRAYTPDYRNRKRQKYCQQPDCRKAAKAAGQRAWLTKPENQDYFRGPNNTRRVQQWRLENPEPRKPAHRQLPSLLQDPLKAEAAEQQSLTASAKVDALQEICHPQPALFVGLISILTGNALQDDIAASARLFVSRGRDILGMGLGGSATSNDQKHTHSVPRTTAARASPV